MRGTERGEKANEWDVRGDVVLRSLTGDPIAVLVARGNTFMRGSSISIMQPSIPTKKLRALDTKTALNDRRAKSTFLPSLNFNTSIVFRFCHFFSVD